MQELMRNMLELPGRCGQLMDSVVSRVLHSLGGSPIPGPRTRGGWSAIDRWPAAVDSAGAARPAAIEARPVAAATAQPVTVVPRAIIGRSPEHGPPQAEERDITDKDLGGTLLKLVRYAIVVIDRDRERVLPHGRGEVLVRDPQTAEQFTNFIIGRYFSSAAYRRLAARHPRMAVGPEARQNLRVHFRVLERWSRPSLEYERRQLDALEGIRRAILAAAVEPVVPLPEPPLEEPEVSPAAAKLKGGHRR